MVTSIWGPSKGHGWKKLVVTMYTPENEHGTKKSHLFVSKETHLKPTSILGFQPFMNSRVQTYQARLETCVPSCSYPLKWLVK